MDSAWEIIHIEVRPEVLRRVTRIARRSEIPEDLWAEALTRLMSDDAEGATLVDGRRPARIRRFRGIVPMPAFISVVAKRIALDRIRILSRERCEPLITAKDQPAMECANPSPQAEVESMELADRFIGEFRTAFHALSPKRQALLSLIYGPGMRKADAGRVVGIRDYKVSRELGATKQLLRDQLNLHAPGTWTARAIERWIRAFSQLTDLNEGGDAHDT
jgi:RNA polymerase sigma factor (sigma-70 family)